MTQSPEILDISGLNIETPQNGLGSVDEASTRKIPTLSDTNLIIREYLRNHETVFSDLDDLRKKVSFFTRFGCLFDNLTQGWESVEADKHFQNLQQSADHPDDNTKAKFYLMNQKLGKELDDKTDAFYVKKQWGAAVASLNLCMAPGGYTWYFLERNPQARSVGITLATEKGGHPMFLPHGEDDERVEVKFMDITMLTSEFGTPKENVPSQHPEAGNFSDDTPFLGEYFDVVICDGQVLRVHQHQRSPGREIIRLLVSQLILGLQRIKTGGTFIILLHKIDVWDNMILLKTFESFSKIQVYKSENIHAGRSSFYLVAKNVEPSKAAEAVANWKRVWWRSTFEGESGTGLDPDEPSKEEVESVLTDYGERLRQLGGPIWLIQLKAMMNAGSKRNGGATRWNRGRSRRAGLNRSGPSGRPDLRQPGGRDR